MVHRLLINLLVPVMVSDQFMLEHSEDVRNVRQITSVNSAPIDQFRSTNTTSALLV
jgi:hypothetical protein